LSKLNTIHTPAIDTTSNRKPLKGLKSKKRLICLDLFVFDLCFVNFSPYGVSASQYGQIGTAS